MGLSVQVGGDSSVPHLGCMTFPQVQQVACIFFRFLSEFIKYLLNVFDFVGKIPCGCWTILKMPTGVGAGSFEAEFGDKHVLTGYLGGYCL